MVDLNEALADTASLVEKFLDQLLAVEDSAERQLIESMRYASLNGQTAPPFSTDEKCRLVRRG